MSTAQKHNAQFLEHNSLMPNANIIIQDEITASDITESIYVATTFKEFSVIFTREGNLKLHGISDSYHKLLYGISVLWKVGI